MLGRYRSQWWQLKRYVQNISLRIERTRSKLMPEIAIGVKKAPFELRCVVYLRLARNDRYSRSIVCLGDSHNGSQTEVLRRMLRVALPKKLKPVTPNHLNSRDKKDRSGQRPKARTVNVAVRDAAREMLVDI